MQRRRNSGLLIGASLLVVVGMGSGCQPVHEPWTNNGKAWKEEHFKTNAPNSELRERLITTQIDR